MAKAQGGKFIDGVKGAAIGFGVGYGVARIAGAAAGVARSSNDDGTAIFAKDSKLESDREAFRKEIEALVTDGTLNPSRSFDSADAAAREVLTTIAPLSAKYTLEAFGNIIMDNRGAYHYSVPQIGFRDYVMIPLNNIGYHTHPFGGLVFSNLRMGSENDAMWVRNAKKSLYLGVKIGNKVSMGVCEYNACSPVGSGGTKPTREI